MTVHVADNPDGSRYEIFVDGSRAGFSEYKLSPGRISFLHTVIDEEYSGQGLGRQLVDYALADARDRALAVLPFCPYVRSVIKNDPERYLDLVPEEERARFQLP